MNGSFFFDNIIITFSFLIAMAFICKKCAMLKENYGLFNSRVINSNGSRVSQLMGNNHLLNESSCSSNEL